MNPFDRMPGPGPRGDGDYDGLDALHVFGMFVGVTLAVVALVLFAMLVWNSFKVRGELRGLRADVARLGGAPGGSAPGGVAAGAPGHAASAAPAGVNHGLLAVPPAPPTPPVPLAPPAPPMSVPAPPVPPAPPAPPAPPTPPAAKAPRAPRKKPTDTAG